MQDDAAGVVRVRAATAADLEQVSRVRVRSWQAGYAGLLPGEVLGGMSAAADLVRRRQLFGTLGDRVGTLVAECTSRGDTALVGFANLGGYRLTEEPLENAPLSSSEGEIYALYVDPAHWRGGAGRALLAGCLAWLAERGLAPARLWVLRDNARARGFYEAQGFRPDGAARSFRIGEDVAVPEVRYTRPDA